MRPKLIVVPEIALSYSFTADILFLRPAMFIVRNGEFLSWSHRFVPLEVNQLHWIQRMYLGVSSRTIEIRIRRDELQVGARNIS